MFQLYRITRALKSLDWTLVNVKIDFGLLVFRSLNVFAAQLISNKLKFVTNRSPWSFKPVLTVRTEQL